MGRRKHKPWTAGAKREAYKARRAKPDYPRGGFGGSHVPYGKSKRGN